MDTEQEIAALIEGTGGGARRISYDVLSQATNSFSDDAVLEESYGGVVYKASFQKPNGSEVVAAVEKLRGSFPEQTKKDFLREITNTGNISHRYLVPLLGWCDEHDELLLVYHVSLPIHSLDMRVFDDEKSSEGPVLCWTDRFGIACGLASGVDYLHTGSNKCVIHRDIKPKSVMLDPNRTPKLGNFWLARVCGHGEAINDTLAWGTYDYMDPEIYHEGEKASKESDVYSFGIVALELATGRRHERLRSLVSQVWRLHEEDRIVEAVGEGLRGSAGFDESQARRLLVAGLWCCHTRGSDRPKLMEQVIAVLHGYTSLFAVRIKPMDAYLKLPSISPSTSQDSGQVGPHMVAEDENSGVVNQEAAAPLEFSHDKLHKATNGFRRDNVIGHGTGGVVYVGELENKKVAVKKLAPDFHEQSDEELHVEIRNTYNLKHNNLVKLIGWCSHEKHNREKETLLVLEYMPRLSLDTHLFGKKLDPISWGIRYKIACGLAAAVSYLHTGISNKCMIHRDIKPGNVMLDEDWTPKLGDFGLSRLSDRGKSMKTTVTGGTFGYIAPEVQSGEKASMKSDVYSFGKVALEIATGKMACQKQPNGMSLLLWVWNLHVKEENGLLDAVYEKLQLIKPAEIEEAKRLLVVGLWCCNKMPSKRPQMKQVIAVLHGDTPLCEAVAQVEEQKNYFAGLEDDINEFSSMDSGQGNSLMSGADHQ